MKKRIFLTAIWFYVAWYAAVLVAAFAGISQNIGPVIGILVGALVWFSPQLAARRNVNASTVAPAYRSHPDGASSR